MCVCVRVSKGQQQQHIHTQRGNSLVIAGRVRVVKVTVGVGSAEDAHAQPAEVLLAGSARHLVAAVHFLQTETGSVSEEVMKKSRCSLSMKLTGTQSLHVWR